MVSVGFFCFGQINLLFFLLPSIIATICSSLSLLPLDTARATTTEWGGESEVNVLLRVKSNHVRWHVDDLPANTDVTLLDQHTSVVNGLGKTELTNASLQAAFQKVFNLQSQDVIELHAGFIKNANTDKTANQGIAFEEALGILFVKGEKFTSSTTNLG